MFPDQIQLAIDENWPVVFAAGVLEYHGEHCCFGVDTLLVDRILTKLEVNRNIVIMPSLFYGPSSYAVAGPEQGSIHIDSDIIEKLARQLFYGLLRTGFRSIHVFICHQSENFLQGMPTDLAFRTAARRCLFDYLEKELGEGWWGNQRYNSLASKGQNTKAPLDWIQIHPLFDDETMKKYPLDHAGITETSLMMALCPEGVDTSKLKTDAPWFCKTALESSVEHGQAIVSSILAGMLKTISLDMD